VGNRGAAGNEQHQNGKDKAAIHRKPRGVTEARMKRQSGEARSWTLPRVRKPGVRQNLPGCGKVQEVRRAINASFCAKQPAQLNLIVAGSATPPRAGAEDDGLKKL
jgi:hypothetical protein